MPKTAHYPVALCTSLLMLALFTTTVSAQDTSLPPKALGVAPGFDAPKTPTPGFDDGKQPPTKVAPTSKTEAGLEVGTRTSLTSLEVQASRVNLKSSKERQQVRALHGVTLRANSNVIAIRGKFAVKGKDKPQLALYDEKAKTLTVFAGSERIATQKNFSLSSHKQAKKLGAPSPLFAVQLVDDGIMELVALTGKSSKKSVLKLHKVFDNYVGESLKFPLRGGTLTSAVTCIKAPKHFLLKLDAPKQKTQFLMWNPWEGLFRVPTPAAKSATAKSRS